MSSADQRTPSSYQQRLPGSKSDHVKQGVEQLWALGSCVCGAFLLGMALVLDTASVKVA